MMDIVRSTLQPVTRALPAPLFKAGVALLGTDCYKTLVLDIAPESSPECVKLAVSKVLGIGIVGASSIVKVPQILKLIQSKSAAGISILSYILETATFVVTLAYNARSQYPFSTYGEIALVAIQNVVVCLLVLKYQGQNAAAGAFVGVLAAAIFALQDEKIFDMTKLGYAQTAAGVMGVGSKLPQIWTIYQQGGTGELSAFTVFNYVAGSFARVFTTIQEVNDSILLYGVLAGFLLNAVIAGQMVYYWNSPKTAPHAGEIGKKPKEIAMGSSTGASARKGPTTRRRG